MCALKSGDLVIVVSAHCDNKHAIGRVLTLSKKSTCNYTGVSAWVTTPEVFRVDKPAVRLIFAEQSLRKIEDKPGEDETFRWAGKPIKEEMP